MYLVVRLEKIRDYTSRPDALWSGVCFQDLKALQSYHEDCWSDSITGNPFVLEYDFMQTCPKGCEPDNRDLVKFLLEKKCPLDTDIIIKVKGAHPIYLYYNGIDKNNN